jgi:hypothetical protein
MKYLSNIISAASGAMGGMVAARSSQGLYMRARVTPVNVNSEAQQLVRQTLSNLAVYWSQTLTEQQRENWRVYASQVTHSNVFGLPINWSGFGEFVHCNQVRVLIGTGIRNQAPADLTSMNVQPFTGVIDASAKTLVLTFDAGDTWNEVGGGMSVRLSGPAGLGVNFFGRGKVIGSIKPIIGPEANPKTFNLSWDPLVGQRYVIEAVAAEAGDARVTSILRSAPVTVVA